MIVKNFEIEKVANKINYFLFYGENSGFINDTIENLFKINYSGHIYTYDELDLIKDDEIIKNLILNKSFFEDEKLVIINRVTDKFYELFNKIHSYNTDGIKIILKAGILEKKSIIRKFFESENNILISAFYEDNYQTLLNLAKNFIQKKQLKISIQNVNYIIERSRNNRIILKKELEKIALFGKNKSFIEIKDILKLTNLAEDYKISELIDHYFANNNKKLLNILNENNFLKEEDIIILRMFLSKLKRLKKIKEQFVNKKNLDIIITNLRPPVFWKDKEILKKQVEQITLDKINHLIKKVTNIELNIKKNPNFSNKIISNFILEN